MVQEIRRWQRMPTAIQRLYETCKEVFSDVEAGTVPAPHDVERLRTVLDNMEASDVGLTPNLPYFWNIESEGAPPISYLPIYECDKFTICIFCLPPSGVIPLHNHPGMTVFSKLLFGTMYVKSYDWVDAPRTLKKLGSTSGRLAKVKTDSIFAAPCETSILYPNSGGNMHCFTAKTPCALLDVLGPPYSEPDGRHCSYYNDLPNVDKSLLFGGTERFFTWLEEREKAGERFAWLEKREKPEDHFVLGAKYRGPRIIEN